MFKKRRGSRLSVLLPPPEPVLLPRRFSAPQPAWRTLLMILLFCFVVVILAALAGLIPALGIALEIAAESPL